MPKKLLIAICAVLSLALAAASLAAPSKRREDRPKKTSTPTRIALPKGWQPEGIDARGNRLYVGSIPTGSIWLASAKTGKGELLVTKTDRAAIGLEVKHGLIYVAGGSKGKAYLYDAKSGADVAEVQLAPAGVDTFVNDVAIWRGHAYFTDSRRAVLYVVSKDGKTARELPLTGITLATTPSNTNLNGIVSAGRGRLLAVQSNTGKLWLIDAATGNATQVDLGSYSPAMGDGMLLRGRTLYILQNRINTLAVVKLAGDLRSGRLVKTVTRQPPEFDVPTTLAAARKGLYLVNARFGTSGPQPADYWITRIRRP